jgi:hypothetical protein
VRVVRQDGRVARQDENVSSETVLLLGAGFEVEIIEQGVSLVWLQFSTFRARFRHVCSFDIISGCCHSHKLFGHTRPDFLWRRWFSFFRLDRHCPWNCYQAKRHP